ncbi:MAG: DUF6428 family protein [Pseudomonadota bacterium]
MMFSQFVDELSGHEPGAKLLFYVDGVPIGTGFHVTEVLHRRVAAIDCGGNRDGWDEAVLQILDGNAGEQMVVGKLLGILRQCTGKIPALLNTPLYAEFGFDNANLQRFVVNYVSSDEGGVRIELGAVQAKCKPMSTMAQQPCGDAQACCG